MSRIEIDLDDRAVEGLRALAASRNQSAEALATLLLRQSIRYEAERAEDEQRWEAIEQGDYIENDDMMRWLEDLAKGKDV